MRFLLIILALVLSACATSYGDMGFNGGVKHEWTAPDILVVEAVGNGYTEEKKVSEMALLWAAEQTYIAQYAYFLPYSSDNLGKKSTFYTPTTTTTSVRGRANTTYTGTTVQGYGGVSNTYGTANTDIYGSATTTTEGGMPIVVFRPGVRLYFYTFDEVPEEIRPGQYYETEAIIKELGPKYLKDYAEKYPQFVN
jgi:hypothetical protein